MSDQVSVELAHPYKGKAPGERIEVSPDEAKLLVRQGRAVPAKVSDAKEIGADPASAGTQRAKAATE